MAGLVSIAARRIFTCSCLSETLPALPLAGDKWAQLRKRLSSTGFKSFLPQGVTLIVAKAFTTSRGKEDPEGAAKRLFVLGSLPRFGTRNSNVGPA